MRWNYKCDEKNYIVIKKGVNLKINVTYNSIANITGK